MPRTRSLIKAFLFREEDRPAVTLGPNTRINPLTNRAQLLAAAGVYPLTANLFVRSALTNPTSARQWIGFEANVLHTFDESGAQVTAATYRLSDGVTDFYWSGTAWLAATTQWTSEANVANNIAAFPTTSGQLQIIVNLSTTDARFTPELESIKVLYASDIEFEEDLIYRSLVAALQASVRPVTQLAFPMQATSDVIQLNNSSFETGYNIDGVDSVFDHTADPTHRNDLFQSLSGGSIQLTAPINNNNVAWVRFFYRPEIAVSTSQDFVRQEKLPAIVIDEINLDEAIERTPSWGQESVANKAAGTCVVLPAPLQGDLSFRLLIMADKAVDMRRIADQLKAFFRNHPVLKSTGLDEPYTLRLVDKLAPIGNPDQDEISMSALRGRLVKVRYWLKDAYTDTITLRLRMNFPGESGSTNASTPAGTQVPLT